MPKPTAIQIQHLHFAVEEKIILNDIDLNLEKGKFYGVLGPNGSGKTTLLRHIAKTLEVKPRTIFLNEEDLRQIKIGRLAREIATVPQDINISFDFSTICFAWGLLILTNESDKKEAISFLTTEPCEYITQATIFFLWTSIPQQLFNGCFMVHSFLWDIDPV